MLLDGLFGMLDARDAGGLASSALVFALALAGIGLAVGVAGGD